ncbi:hypothetical protein LINPERPRIM_LOCUS43466, partial [Linum perenne]
GNIPVRGDYAPAKISEHLNPAASAILLANSVELLRKPCRVVGVDLEGEKMDPVTVIKVAVKFSGRLIPVSALLDGHFFNVFLLPRNDQGLGFSRYLKYSSSGRMIDDPLEAPGDLCWFIFAVA